MRLYVSGKKLRKEHDKTPYGEWAGYYDDIFRFGGDKFECLNIIRDLLSQRYRIVLKLTNIRDDLFVNGKARLIRNSKFAPVKVLNDTKIIKGTPLSWGGSNSHPHISFEEDEVIVEIITKGFPNMEMKRYNLNIEILELEKI